MIDLELAGKRVLVTGGTSGIGTAIALAFAEQGARVAINGATRDAEAEALAAKLGADAFVIAADVSKPDLVARMFAEIDRRWGGIDVLVNNAGIDGPRARGWEADLDAWSRVIDINLMGAFYCAREALKRMIPAKAGVILNTTSVHEVIAWAGYSAYTASKAGLSMMSKTLGQEAAPYGVRVVAIAPGAIGTPINAAVWKDKAGLADLLGKIPLGRVGQPRDIAEMAVVLASPRASYMTATTVFIDGGMTDYPGFAHGG
jgi:NAD(P)-dependent dehydrogenase (short-subunit alcohol dehydrogenase family)